MCVRFELPPLFPILRNPNSATEPTCRIQFNMGVTTSPCLNRRQFGMVHGSINNDEDEVMLPRRENTWEKAQKISSYGNARQVSGCGLLIADFIVSIVFASLSLYSKNDHCDQPLRVFLEFACFLQLFLDVLSVCLYVEKVNVTKGKLDAVAGLLCAQNCCVLNSPLATRALSIAPNSLLDGVELVHLRRPERETHPPRRHRRNAHTQAPS